MSERRISIDQLGGEIQRQLNWYATEVINGVEKAAEQATLAMVETTKQRPNKDPRAKGRYVRHHAAKAGEKTLTARSWIWYARPPMHTRAHLLNDNHRTRNHRGVVPGDHHIDNAARQAVEQFEREVREVIERAGN